jgi:zinc protease
MKKQAINKSLLILTAALIPLCVSAQRNKVTETRLPFDPAVRTGKLANGFTYFIRNNKEPQKRVELYLVNKVGSVLEDSDQQGLAHFMEHMNFNGTKHFPKNSLVNYLQKSGIRFGADLNAYTNFDETVYQLPIPSDKPELLSSGLEIMHDWAQSATLDPAEIEKERGVVLEEKRLGKGAGERMERLYYPMILNNSRYSKRLPIGIDTVLESFKPATIRRFYRDWYRPNLQALIVVGDIDVNEMERRIKSKFSDLKNPGQERTRTKFEVELKGKNHFIAVTDKEMTTTQVQVIVKYPAAGLKTEADYRKMIVQSLFNNIIAARISELVQQSDPPFVFGSAVIGSFIGNLDAFSVSVFARPGEIERGVKATWQEVERVKRFGFTATELERAKQAFLLSMDAALKEKNKTSSENYVQEYVSYFLKGIASPGIEREYQLSKSILPTVKLADLKALANGCLTDVNRDVLVLAPEKDKRQLPDELTLNGWLNEIKREPLAPYQDHVSNENLLAADPAPGKIISVKKDAGLNTTTWIFENGLKIILKPTTFKDNEILFTGFAPGGSSMYADADYQSATNASDIIPLSGAGNYTAKELNKYLSVKQLHVDPYITDRFSVINGGATPGDFGAALQLVNAYFTGPRKDSAKFNAIITRNKALIANRANDPRSCFSDSIKAIIYHNNIRRTGPSAAKLSEINLDRAYDIYKECFGDASNFTFVFTGNIDTTTFKPLLEKYLGSLPSGGPLAKPNDLLIPTSKGLINKIIYKGSEPQSSVFLLFSGKLDYIQENLIKLDALKECLEIRLLQRLREEESSVYSPSVSISAAKYPESSYQLVVQFGCAPQNVERLIASVTNEADKLVQSGPPQENVDKWRLEDKTSTEPALRTNGFWLNYLKSTLQNNEDLHQIDQYNIQRDRISVQDVKDAASQYLKGDNFIRVVLMPETSIGGLKNKTGR